MNRFELVELERDIDAYAEWCEANWSRHKSAPGAIFDERSLTIMSLGLGGEVGEVLEVLKKRIRDGRFDKEELALELGDVLYYWSALCRAFDLRPSEIIGKNKGKILDRRKVGRSGNGQ